MSAESARLKPALSLPPFRNERVFPGVSDPKVQKEFPLALAQVRRQLGGTYPLYIDGRNVTRPNPTRLSARSARRAWPKRRRLSSQPNRHF
jgi:hypothetical protein